MSAPRWPERVRPAPDPTLVSRYRRILGPLRPVSATTSGNSTKRLGGEILEEDEELMAVILARQVSPAFGRESKM